MSGDHGALHTLDDRPNRHCTDLAASNRAVRSSLGRLDPSAECVRSGSGGLEGGRPYVQGLLTLAADVAAA